MKKRKLNYRFHNPNTAEVTADYLLKILIEANASKVEQAIQEAADELPNEPKHDGGYHHRAGLDGDTCRMRTALCYLLA